MALTIRNERIERLAQQVAKETGESLTKAIEVALIERLERLKRRHHAPMLVQALEDILRRVDNLPTMDTRAETKILGWDDRGLPADRC
jgi:antitoxin VapB